MWRVALQDGDDVVAFEQGEDGGGVGDQEGLGKALVTLSPGGAYWRTALTRGTWQAMTMGVPAGVAARSVMEPGELDGIDEGVEVAGGRDLDGVEQDEVVALVVEGAVGLGVEALLEGFFCRREGRWWRCRWRDRGRRRRGCR